MEYEMIERLTCTGQRPLWDISAPYKERVNTIKKVHEQLKVEHAAACEDDDVNGVDAGVLLGALNLVSGLLQEELWERKMPDELIFNNGLPADDQEREDAVRLARVAREHGRDWTVLEAFKNWEAYSLDMDAGWIYMPDSDEALWENYVSFERKRKKGQGG